MLNTVLIQKIQDSLQEVRGETTKPQELQIITTCTERIIAEGIMPEVSESMELDTNQLEAIERKLHLLAGDSQIPFERSLYLNIASVISHA